MLGNFVGDGRVNEPGSLEELAQVLGAGAGPTAGALVEAWPGWSTRLRYQFKVSRDLHERYRRLGSTLAARSYSPGLSSALVPTGPDANRAPFGGAGATGVPGTELSISLRDKYWLWRRDSATTARYSNPIPGSLPAYLAGLTPIQRRGQARQLLVRPIHSVVPFSYRQGRPSRADVMIAAGRVHRLEPALVAAFILAEQRDQSRNEDAKDYIAATSMTQGNTSIGLGQVVVSTARKNDLFADLLGGTRAALSHDQIAELLVSEEFNIFAVARYLRLTANAAVGKTAATMSNTNARFPGINFAAYGRPSAEWPIDNIRALGSEYTSTPWDDKVTVGWADFVFEAYMDMKSAGVF